MIFQSKILYFRHPHGIPIRCFGQCIGFSIIDELLFFIVPVQFVSQAVGDVSHVGKTGNADAGFDVAVGFVSGLHAIDEIGYMQIQSFPGSGLNGHKNRIIIHAFLFLLVISSTLTHLSS